MSDLSYFTTCFNDLSKVFTFDDPKSKEDAGGYKKGTLKIAVDAKRTNKSWEYKISVPVPAEPNLTNGSIMEEEVVMIPNQEKQKRRIKKKDENNDDEWYMWKIEGQPPEGAKVYDAARVKVYLDADLKVRLQSSTHAGSHTLTNWSGQTSVLIQESLAYRRVKKQRLTLTPRHSPKFNQPLWQSKVQMANQQDSNAFKT